MDRTEAANALDELLAGFPFTDLDVAARGAWVEAIEDAGADPGHAREIARRWCRTHERFPTLAEFLTVITPRIYVEPVDNPDEMRVPPVVANQMTRLWRDAIGAANADVGHGADGHWHGGPTPCSMCGGMKPPWA